MNSGVFYGDLWDGMTVGEIDGADVLIKGIPFDNAASVSKGAAQGPDRIRQLSRELPAVDETGQVFGGLRIYDGGDFHADLVWERFFATVEGEAKKMMETGKFCLFLGGDHSISIPLTKAFGQVYLKKEKIGYIHFDAHSDLCDSLNGHKWSHACPARRALDNCPNLSTKDMTFVGIRGFEPEEVEFYSAHPEILCITGQEVFEEGIHNVVKRLLERYKDHDTIYLTLDIDVLDPAFAPGTGTPEAGGLSSRELLFAMKTLVRELPIRAMDLVEVSPPLDSSSLTSWAALKVLYTVFAQIYMKCSQG